MAAPTPTTGVAAPSNAQPTSKAIPFRRATVFRTSINATDTDTMTTSEQQIQQQVQGSGYMAGLKLIVTGTTAGNSADVAFKEDAPFAALSSVVLADSNGQYVNLPGYSLYLANLYAGFFKFDPATSTDTNVYNKVTGTGSTGGSFKFPLYVPCVLNNRDLIGLIGYQDRAEKLWITDNIAASGTVYSTAPTALPSVQINRYYENYSKPAATNGNGEAQETVPPKYGVLSFLTQSVNPSAPQGGSTVNHYLDRIGNGWRTLILVLRSNGSRATAESNMPSNITFKIGDTTLFNETVEERRLLMFERYGIDAPDGVLVYDFLTDFLGNEAGAELGWDYIFTKGLTSAEFDLTYPSGMGSTNNSLTVITSDLIVPQGVSLY